MRKRLYLRVTLTTGEDDDSISTVGAERIHIALCTGFPYMAMSDIEVVDVATERLAGKQLALPHTDAPVVALSPVMTARAIVERFTAEENAAFATWFIKTRSEYFQ